MFPLMSSFVIVIVYCEREIGDQVLTLQLSIFINKLNYVFIYLIIYLINNNYICM